MKFRLAHLLCILYGLAGLGMCGFSAIWSLQLHYDQSQFFQTMAIGISWVVISILGFYILKLQEEMAGIMKIKDELFDFEGWTRDKLEKEKNND